MVEKGDIPLGRKITIKEMEEIREQFDKLKQEHSERSRGKYKKV